MNARKRVLLIKFVTLLVATAVAVLILVNLKDWINRGEAMRAMEELGRKVLEYKAAHGSMPPEAYVNEIRPTLQGSLRLGRLHYRAQWIGSDSPPEEILAYSEKRYRSLFVQGGYVVLRLDGSVHWMKSDQFESLQARFQESRQDPSPGL